MATLLDCVGSREFTMLYVFSRRMGTRRIGSVSERVLELGEAVPREREDGGAALLGEEGEYG